MHETSGAPQPTTAEWAVLVIELQGLRTQIEAQRAAAAPREAEIELAHAEYQAAIADTFRLYREVRGSVLALEAQARAATQRAAAVGQAAGAAEADRRPATADPGAAATAAAGEAGAAADPERELLHSVKPAQRREAEQKDDLVQYLVWVVGADDQHGQLVQEMQGMNRDAAARLADMLEAMPAHLYGESTGAELDNPALRRQRLLAWHTALAARLAELQQAAASLATGQKFALWQQRQQGEESWQRYLARERQRWQEEVVKLQIRKAELLRTVPKAEIS